jgi:oxygen-dependent protoporphyrinogen oxidase
MIAIVGGGLTGLALGHELTRLGVPHLVLEAADRPGGVIRSERVEGHLLEWGPQRTRLGGLVGELVGELGLEDEVITAPSDLPLFVYRAGRLRTVPFSASAFLRSDIVSWPAKLRLLAEPLTSAPHPDERVADFLSRKVGRELYENMLGPLYGGLYASDPADMRIDLSLGHVLREFGIGRSLLLPLLRRGGRLSPPPACSFREGMQTLPDALFRAEGEQVRLNTPVRSIRPISGGYAVETDGETIEAEQVVVTIPARSAGAVLRDAAPDAASRAARLVYNPLVVVHLYAETELRGLGYQVSFAEKLLTRGVTFNDSLFGRQGVYTAYLGGSRAPQVTHLPEEELAEIAVREFREVTGYTARALAVRRERMPAWDVSWEALQGIALPPGLHIAANWESRRGVPGRLALAMRVAAGVGGGGRSGELDT